MTEQQAVTSLIKNVFLLLNLSSKFGIWPLSWEIHVMPLRNLASIIPSMDERILKDYSLYTLGTPSFVVHSLDQINR